MNREAELALTGSCGAVARRLIARICFSVLVLVLRPFS